jgi:hypothetical protein
MSPVDAIVPKKTNDRAPEKSSMQVLTGLEGDKKTMF